jgi:hypothetical protein
MNDGHIRTRRVGHVGLGVSFVRWLLCQGRRATDDNKIRKGWKQ